MSKSLLLWTVLLKYYKTDPHGPELIWQFSKYTYIYNRSLDTTTDQM